MSKLRNSIAEVIPWIICLICCGVGAIKINELNQRTDAQEAKLEVVSGALAEIKQATQHDEWTPTQKTQSIEQVLAMTEEACKKGQVE
jgi:hypothetical protein